MNQKLKTAISIISLSLVVLISTHIQAQTVEEVDIYAQYISQRYNIPGMSIGVIKNGQILHKAHYGMYDLESKEELDHESLFNLHSLSKVFVNVAIFKLIEAGKLNLDDEVAHHISDYPSHWESTRIEHLLSHSSGLPNIIHYFSDDLESTKVNLYKAASKFKPGSNSDYNQTNYWLLNRIINALSPEGFDDTIKKQIAGAHASPLIFDHELSVNRSQPKEYRPHPSKIFEVEYSKVDQFMNGAGGINITLDDFTNWNLKLDKDQLISSSSKEKMFAPYSFEEGQHEFAHGWAIYHSNGTTSRGFSGGGVAGLRKFVDSDLTIIVLTNGYQYGFDINTFINRIAHQVDDNLPDPASAAHIELYECFTNHTLDEAMTLYTSIIDKYSMVDMDPVLNSLGYELLGKNHIEGAMAVFKLNTEEHPNSWNAWDSLAECYETTGNISNAILNYKKSLQINSKNTHATDRLQKLNSSQQTSH